MKSFIGSKEAIRKMNVFPPHPQPRLCFLFLPCRTIDPSPSSPPQKAEVIPSEGDIGAEYKLQPKQVFSPSLHIPLFQT